MSDEGKGSSERRITRETKTTGFISWRWALRAIQPFSSMASVENPKDKSMGQQRQTRGATPKQGLTGLYPGEYGSVRTHGNRSEAGRNSPR